MRVHHGRHRVLLVGILAGLMGASLGAAPAAATAPAFTFDFQLDQNEIDLVGPLGTSVTLSTLSATPPHSVINSCGGTTDAVTGALHLFCFDAGLRAGDILDASGGAKHRTFTIPAITVAMDRVTDVVKGTGPHQSKLKVSVKACSVQMFICKPKVSRTRPTSATGAWSTDFTGAYDVLGEDEVDVVFTSSKGDHVRRISNVPFMSFFVDTSLVRGQVNAGQATTFTLKAGGNVIATSHTTGAGGGDVEGTFKHNGVPVLLDRGDKITGTFASDAKITVPAQFDVSGDAVADTISGHCLPNRPVNLNFFGDTGVAIGTANSSGFFTVVAPGLNNGDVDVYCRTPAGDQLSIRGAS